MTSVRLHFTICIAFCTLQLFAQEPSLSYYLPNYNYDPEITTPKEFLRYEVGEWHVTHDQLRFYMERLAEESERVTIEEYARSYENRPLQLLTITSPRNHARLDDIIAYRQMVAEGEADSTRQTDQPVVLYQGYTIHGNEASGANAALLIAYHLAAARNDFVKNLLDSVVILLDPCYNPDGLQRFSTWVNAHKNKTITTDPADREYDESWPGGRTNHYWFDLNRDWLLLQHPESRGRIANFQKWKPNILTDHHEMGTNSTFFFMPGEPTRVNPTTPQENQDLTAAIATYHAAELDAIGSLYYSGEGFDDFYYGKGSTYPDANGCIGILFEQASARGHAQESVNGTLTFPFAIRNQVITSISTHKAALGLHKELTDFHHRFFQDNLSLAADDPVPAYVFGSESDPSRLNAFVEILLQHEIDVYDLDEDSRGEYQYIVPTGQAQYRMVKAVFDRQVEFEDSLFYDVSAWTLPLAFNLEHRPVEPSEFGEGLFGDQVEDIEPREGAVKGGRSPYGYCLPWDDYFAPNAAYAIMSKGLRVRVSAEPFQARTAVGDIQMNRGTLFVPSQNQYLNPTDVFLVIDSVARNSRVNMYSMASGFTENGPDMGSRNMAPVRTPEVLLAVGDGVSGYEAGEVWHLLDQRYEIPVSKVEVSDFDNVDLTRYTCIILPDGSYYSMSKKGIDALKEWTASGGVLIVLRNAMNWAGNQGLLNAERLKSSSGNGTRDFRPYSSASRDRGGSVLGGAIFEVEADLTHPLLYGYSNDSLAVFRRGTTFYKPSNNIYATPLRYTDEPLLAGYINTRNLEELAGSASALVGRYGSGRVIGFADKLCFRAYWWGTQKILANAIFFGHTISSRTAANPGAPANDKE